MDYACTVLTALNKSQRHWPEVIQNRFLQYARGTVDPTSISNNELCSGCNIKSVEQRVLALANNWCRKASDNNDDIANSTYHYQTNTNKKYFWIISKVIGSYKPIYSSCFNVLFWLFQHHCLWLIVQFFLYLQSSLKFRFSEKNFFFFFFHQTQRELKKKVLFLFLEQKGFFHISSTTNFYRIQIDLLLNTSIQINKE